jgi:hypothetical protein
MRCRKAENFILRNCDELLSESEKMKLLEHLEHCTSCATMALEIDACRKLIEELPERTPTESFEWNLKRRIVQEKALASRAQGMTIFGEWRWGLKFVASAAAVVLIATAGAWLIFGGGEPAQQTRSASTSTHPAGRRPTVVAREQNMLDYYTRPEYPTNLQLVSSGRFTDGAGGYRSLPIQSSLEARLDSLARENEVLRRHLIRLEKERNYYLRLLLQRSARR